VITRIDQISVNYIDEGEGDVILLLHGWGANITLFQGIIETLSPKHRVVALDMPGFGKTPEPPEPFLPPDPPRPGAPLVMVGL